MADSAASRILKTNDPRAANPSTSVFDDYPCLGPKTTSQPATLPTGK